MTEKEFRLREAKLKDENAMLCKALCGLLELCDHVPVFQLDNGKSSVKAIRRAGKFVAAIRAARAALGKATG